MSVSEWRELVVGGVGFLDSIVLDVVLCSKSDYYLNACFSHMFTWGKSGVEYKAWKTS